MSDVNNEFICVMEETIKSKGTINHTIAHGVIVGPGRSGKNTLMSRLMGNGPPDPSSSSPSTGVLENVVKVEVKKLSTVATAVSNLEWMKLEHDEEALELIMTTARHHSAATKRSKPFVLKYVLKEHREGNAGKHVQSSLSLKYHPNIKKQRKYKMFNKLFKKLTKIKGGKSKKHSISKNEEEKKDVVVYKPDIEPVDIFKRAVKLRGMDALREHLESSWSLYLTNTGGQIEFQEHLPLLVCGPSIFFLTFPLHYDLEKPYSVRYEYPDGRVEEYKSPATLLEELLQTLATINAFHFTSGQQRNYESDIKPKVFFVGTHRDCLPADTAEDSIQKKDKMLQDHVRQTSLFRQGSIQFFQPPEQLIFAVNNLSIDDGEFEKIRSAVQQTVERNEFTIECPSSWLILSLILRAKHKSDQVLSFEKCFTIAQECGISDQRELKQALCFIHTRLGLIRYFNTDDLNTLVVIDPQILFDRITDLIVKTFTNDNVEVNEIEDFRQRGIIPLAVMEKISNKDHSDSQIPFKWLTRLLNYLRIAALFADNDGDKYFFPSALCHAPHPISRSITLSNSSNIWPPLLVGFESGFCPRGIPGALIKYLMTNEMKSRTSWDLIQNKIFKNQVSFAIEAHEIITLKILPTHLEISCECEGDLDVHSETDTVTIENTLAKKTCKMAYVQIRKGLRTVTSQCKECNFFFGFYCTMTSTCRVQHPAKIQWDNKNPFKLVCKVTNKRGNLPKGYEIWSLQKNPVSGKTELEKEIDACNNGVLKHLGQIADSMTEWEGRISEELLLTPADVASILTQFPNKLKLQTRAALHMWKQRLGSDATYQKLIDVFESAGYRSYAEIVRSIAGSEVDDYSDYDEPLPQPETYPYPNQSPPVSPKVLTHEISTRDEFVLLNPAAAQDLPQSDIYSHKVLDSCNVSVVPLLSSHGIKSVDSVAEAPSSTSESTESFPIYIGMYDFEMKSDGLLNFLKGDLIYVINAGEDDWWFARLKDNGKEGFIPKTFVTMVAEYTNEKWFFGNITRAEAVRWLMMPCNQHGSYLVRNSETTPGQYSLSVRDREKVMHYRIQQSNDGEFFINSHARFKTIGSLITYHQHLAEGVAAKLTHPCILADESQNAGNDLEIDQRQIKLINNIRVWEGEFSEVWEGLWNGNPVAVRTRKPENTTLSNFLQVASLMKTLHHERLIHVYGVCTKEEPIYIITEPIRHGNLLDYLRKENRPLLILTQLIEMSKQVAEGMAYLEQRKIIHRDLAARNILLKETDFVCKLVNFDMAQMIKTDFFKPHDDTIIRYKWTAPEAAVQKRFSIKSDVWSFGIVLYEIITQGHEPYPGIPDRVVLNEIQLGYRMLQHSECPERLYVIMLDCWQEEPMNRPTFQTLALQLSPWNFFQDNTEPIFGELF